MPNKKRTESDSLGVKKIDSKRLWGAQTQRSLENFKIGNNKIPDEIIVALGHQKKASVLANHSLGLINSKLTKAITKACDQIINLSLIDEFPLCLLSVLKKLFFFELFSILKKEFFLFHIFQH